MDRFTAVLPRARLAPFLALALFVVACGDGTDPPRLTGIRFSSQPASVVAGQTFSVSVELLDANDNRIALPNDTVRLVAEDGTPLGGTTLVEASGGLAMFPAVSINKANANMQLKAVSRTLSAISSSFAVTPATPTAQTSSLGPTTSPVTTGVQRNVTLTFSDAFGNRIAGTPVTVTASLAGVTLSPSSGTTSTAGTFSFALNAVNQGSVVVTASVAGTTIAFAPLVVQAPCTPSPISVPGTATGTLPTETCVVDGLSTRIYGFTTTAPGAVALSLNAPFPSALEVNTIPPMTAVSLRGGTTQNGEWLLPPGNYQARVSALSGAGNFTLAATGVAGTEGQVIRNIVVAGSYEQSLGPGDFVFPELFGDNSFWDVFRLRFDGPCTISARPAGPTGIDLLLVIADAVGNPVLADDNSGGGNDPRVFLDQCQLDDGPIRIMINHYLDIPGGAYTLTIALGASPANLVAVRSAPASWDSVAASIRAAKARRK